MSEATPHSHLEKGTFLIASPEVDSGLFFRAVVLLAEHTPEGSFGLLVNRPLEIELLDEVLNVEEVANPNVELRASGPVQTNQMMILHTSPAIPEETVEVMEGTYLGGDLDFLQQALSDPAGPPLRLCFGFCGWTAGLLEREFLDGGWFLCRAPARHLFETPPEKLWSTLLKEMGGRYASLSMIPEDLSLN
jgi:putative transcriptional regulator